jgi:hypothetical protein
MLMLVHLVVLVWVFLNLCRLNHVTPLHVLLSTSGLPLPTPTVLLNVMVVPKLVLLNVTTLTLVINHVLVSTLVLLFLPTKWLPYVHLLPHVHPNHVTINHVNPMHGIPLHGVNVQFNVVVVFNTVPFNVTLTWMTVHMSKNPSAVVKSNPNHLNHVTLLLVTPTYGLHQHGLPVLHHVMVVLKLGLSNVTTTMTKIILWIIPSVLVLLLLPTLVITPLFLTLVTML